LLLLLPVDFFSPPALLRLLLLLPLLAWLRSLWVSLLPLLDMLPLLPLLPLLFDEEDFELRDAIDISLDRFLRPLRVHWPRVDSRGLARAFCRLCLQVVVGHALCDGHEAAVAHNA